MKDITKIGTDAAIETTLIALVRSHPDRAAFLKVMRAFSAQAFEQFSTQIPEDALPAREHVQQGFDAFVAKMIHAATAD